MTKKELIGKIATKANTTKKVAEEVYNSFVDVVTEEVNTDTETKVEIPGIGTVRTTFKPAHVSKNPRTGEPVDVPDRRTIRISVSDTLKNKLVQPE